MRCSTDRFVTGFLLMMGGSFLVLCLATFFFNVGEVEMRFSKGWYTRHHWRTSWTFRTTVDIQDSRISIPRDTTRFTAPVVRPDGVLDRAHVLEWDSERENFSEARLLTFKRLRPFDPNDARHYLREERDYRSAERGFVFRRWVGRSRWAFSPRLGIVRITREGKFEGSLTDEGWVPGRLSPSTFNQALFWAPEQARAWVYGPGYGRMPDRTLAYVTSEGLYIADLQERVIRRVASLQGAPFRYFLDDTEGRESFYILEGGRIFHVSLAEARLVRTMEPPGFALGTPSPSVAIGTDDRLIFRWPLEAAGDSNVSRYRVAVLDASGRVERDYTYDFAVKGAHRDERLPQEFFTPRIHSDEVLDHTVGGRLSSVVTPPVWRFAGTLVPRGFFSALEQTVELDLDNAAYERPVWPFFLVHGLLAIPLVLRARRRSRGIGAPVLWGVSVVALGLPALLTYAFLGWRDPLVLCPACGRALSAGLDPCPSCDQAAARPNPLGIEVIRPLP